MTPDQKSEHAELFEFSPGYRRAVVGACEISSQSEEIKLGMLATLAGDAGEEALTGSDTNCRS